VSPGLALDGTVTLWGYVRKMVLHTKQVVLENRRVSRDTYVLRTSRSNEPILAGQCFSVGTAGLAINREYSMYSAEDDPFVDFLIRQVEGGAVSTALADLQPGDSVEVGGPYGSFCLDRQDVQSRRYVFIASGTGVAPFSSYVKTFPELDYVLLHGVRFSDERYDSDSYAQDRYIACVSRPEIGEPRRVTQALAEIDLNVNDLYYLCGNRNMITDSIEVLREKGVPGGQIFMETFF